MKNRIETTHGLNRDQLLKHLRQLSPFHSALETMISSHDGANGAAVQRRSRSGSEDGVSNMHSGGGGGLAPITTDLNRFLNTLELYDELVKESGCVDFDDLVGLAVALMQRPQARRAAAGVFR